MRDTLSVNEVSFTDLTNVRNDIYDALEEINEFYERENNDYRLQIENLKQRINLL